MFLRYLLEQGLVFLLRFLALDFQGIDFSQHLRSFRNKLLFLQLFLRESALQRLGLARHLIQLGLELLDLLKQLHVVVLDLFHIVIHLFRGV